MSLFLPFTLSLKIGDSDAANIIASFFVEYKWEVKETMKKKGVNGFLSIYDMDKDEI